MASVQMLYRNVHEPVNGAAEKIKINNHSYFTWDTPTDSLVLLQEVQGFSTTCRSRGSSPDRDCTPGTSTEQHFDSLGFIIGISHAFRRALTPNVGHGSILVLSIHHYKNRRSSRRHGVFQSIETLSKWSHATMGLNLL